MSTHAESALADQLYRTHPGFQSNIRAFAEVAGKTPVEVFALWRKYSDECSQGDQSALLEEFIIWNLADLGGDKHALREAIWK